jgi:NAD+ diphosphatase
VTGVPEPRSADASPLPPLSRSTLDRSGLRRGDAEWLATAWKEGRLLPVDASRGTALVREGAVPSLVLLETDGADASAALFLGVEPDGVAVFAVAGPLPALPQTRAVALRDMGERLSDRDAGLFTTALALANWHARHPYSPATGLPTAVREAGWSRVDAEGNQMWPRTDPAMIVLVHDGVEGPDGRCLLGNNSAWPKQPGIRRFSCLAGYVEPGESAEAAVAREVYEEVGVRLARIDYVASQPWPFPGSLMLGFSAVASPDSAAVRVDGEEIVFARWFTRREIAAIAGGEMVDPGATSEPERASLPMRASIAYFLISRWLG